MPRNPADRPATEPRTAHAIVRQALRMTGMTDAQADARISALLAEAAQGAAPRAEGQPSQLRVFTEWIRDVDPTTTTWNRAKQWAVLALAGVDSVGQLFDPSDDTDDERVHTGIDFGRPEGDYTVDLAPSDERVPHE